MLETWSLLLTHCLTEVLPVSSSWHTKKFYKTSNSYDMALMHGGSAIGMFIFLFSYRHILNITLILWGAMASFPVIIIGAWYSLNKNKLDKKINNNNSYWSLLFGGILMLIGANSHPSSMNSFVFTPETACIVGLFQMLSLKSGMSRLGMTMTGFLILGASWQESWLISLALGLIPLSLFFFGIFIQDMVWYFKKKFPVLSEKIFSYYVENDMKKNEPSNFETEAIFPSIFSLPAVSSLVIVALGTYLLLEIIEKYAMSSQDAWIYEWIWWICVMYRLILAAASWRHVKNKKLHHHKMHCEFFKTQDFSKKE
jgi:uncharacterized membrane protein YjfL (UPF0719 family)